MKTVKAHKFGWCGGYVKKYQKKFPELYRKMQE